MRAGSERVGEPGCAGIMDRNSAALPLLARDLVEKRLAHHVETWASRSGQLSAAAGHALLAPSKRARPVLLCLFAADGDEIPQPAVDAGCAVEMVHTASLILDDLPCMDNAVLRRRRAATHLAFGQTTAILAAISLLSKGFELLGGLPATSGETRARLCQVLSDAVGFAGLSAGQDVDINDRWAFETAEQIEQLNWLKTGILFQASAEMGSLLRGLDGDDLAAVRQFARHLGQAFQTADDLLDRTAGAEEAGKDVGKDRGFPTIVSLVGEARARAECAEHILQAQSALDRTDIAPRAIISYITNLLVGGAVVKP